LPDSVSEADATAFTSEAVRTPLEQVTRLTRVGIDIGTTMSEVDRDEPTPAKARP